MIAAPDLLGVIQAIVREELAAVRVAEIGVVTDVFPHADGGDKANYDCAVRLRDSGLELPHVPVATQRIGLAAIPNVDDLVLVTFVRGDLHAPVITGRLYNDVDRPPVAKAHEWVYVSPDDAESGVRRLHLELPNGNTLTLDDDKALLDMGGTKITVSNAGAVEIDCQDKVTVKSTADISLEASGKLALKAQGDVTVEGMSVALKAQTTAQLEGQASTTVKGPLLTLAGTTSFSAS